jgi:hypothetical protein
MLSIKIAENYFLLESGKDQVVHLQISLDNDKVHFYLFLDQWTSHR